MVIRGSYRWRSKSAGDGGGRSADPPPSPRFCFRYHSQGAEAELSNFDLSLLDDPIVPDELFFVREHFPAPATSSAGWKLRLPAPSRSPSNFVTTSCLSRPRKALPSPWSAPRMARAEAWSAMRNGQAYRSVHF